MDESWVWVNVIVVTADHFQSKNRPPALSLFHCAQVHLACNTLRATWNLEIHASKKQNHPLQHRKPPRGTKVSAIREWKQGRESKITLPVVSYKSPRMVHKTLSVWIFGSVKQNYVIIRFVFPQIFRKLPSLGTNGCLLPCLKMTNPSWNTPFPILGKSRPIWRGNSPGSKSHSCTSHFLPESSTAALNWSFKAAWQKCWYLSDTPITNLSQWIQP